jgi:hypothetical protein
VWNGAPVPGKGRYGDISMRQKPYPSMPTLDDQDFFSLRFQAALSQALTVTECPPVRYEDAFGIGIWPGMNIAGSVVEFEF